MKRMMEYRWSCRPLLRTVLTVAVCQLWLAGSLLLSGCDNQAAPDFEDFMEEEEENDSADVDVNVFTIVSDSLYSGSKTLVVDVVVGEAAANVDLTDSTKIKTEVYTVQHLPWGDHRVNSPSLRSVEPIGTEMVANYGMKVLALVDLSLPQAVIDREQHAVSDIRRLFCRDNLYLAFMSGDSITKTLRASDYVMNNYFRHHDPSHTRLFRSVLNKLHEVTDTVDGKVRKDPYALVVMSDGKVYQHNQPIDPQHYVVQQQLAHLELKSEDHNLQVCYISFADKNAPDSVKIASQNATNIMQSLCLRSGGLYQEEFDWEDLRNNLISGISDTYADYRFTMDFPDGKTFRGRPIDVNIGAYDLKGDSLLTNGSVKIKQGALLRPIIVNPESILYPFLRCCFAALILTLLVWVVFQLIEPFIRNLVFRKRYVVDYTGTQMSVNGHMLGDTCYFCKAPFEIGDKVVAKCEHVMHEECWEENEYHCPEYGLHCHEGVHYYNRHNIFDYRNALFIMKWLVVAIFVALLVWVAHILLIGLLIGPDEWSVVAFWFFGCAIPALFFASLSVGKQFMRYRTKHVLLIALQAGVGGMLAEGVRWLLSIATGLDLDSYWLCWLTIPMATGIIAYAVSSHSRAKLDVRWLMAAVIVSPVIAMLWVILYRDSMVSFPMAVFIAFLIFSVILAICIAHAVPRSERFYLRVEGAVKQMDIALYKWFLPDPHTVVTVGKSVDSTIQMSWDLSGQVSPVHAEIRQEFGFAKLYATGDDVTVGERLLQVGESCGLYHNLQFTIGNTTFTYIEKDR